jgi:hypothetical protein
MDGVQIIDDVIEDLSKEWFMKQDTRGARQLLFNTARVVSSSVKTSCHAEDRSCASTDKVSCSCLDGPWHEHPHPHSSSHTHTLLRKVRAANT